MGCLQTTLLQLPLVLQCKQSFLLTLISTAKITCKDGDVTPSNTGLRGREDLLSVVKVDGRTGLEWWAELAGDNCTQFCCSLFSVKKKKETKPMQAPVKVPLSVLASPALCSQEALPSKRVEGTGKDFWKTQAAGTKITLPLKEKERETNSNLFTKTFFSVLKFLFYRQTKLLMILLKYWIWQQC